MQQEKISGVWKINFRKIIFHTSKEKKNGHAMVQKNNRYDSLTDQICSVQMLQRIVSLGSLE